MGTGEWIRRILLSPFCCRWGSACFLSGSTLPRCVRRSEPGARGFPGERLRPWDLGRCASCLPVKGPKGLVEWLERHGGSPGVVGLDKQSCGYALASKVFIALPPFWLRLFSRHHEWLCTNQGEPEFSVEEQYSKPTIKS
jgi:hypothetical protein